MMICSKIGDAGGTALAGVDQNSKIMMDKMQAGVLLVICVTVGLPVTERGNDGRVEAESGEFLSIYTFCRRAAMLHQVVIMFHR
jgi:uncharacterized membrane protein